MRVTKRIQDLYRQEGVYAAFVRLLRKCGRCIVSTSASYWSERDLSEPIRDMQPKIDVTITFDKREELVEWLKTQQGTWMHDPKELAVAKEFYHVFPFIRYKDEIIAYCKIGVKKVYIQDYDKVIPLPERYGFCYDIYVAPAFRRKNIAGYITTETMKHMKKRGFARAQGQLAPWNKAAIGNFINTGFKKYKYVRYVRLFGFIKLYFTTYIK